MKKCHSSWAEHPWIQNLVGALFLISVAGHISIQLGQDANWDLKNYHWYNAYAFLEGRLGFDIAPAQLQSFHNPLLDLPYFWLARTFPTYPQYTAFMQGAYFGLVVFFLIKIALSVLPHGIKPQAGRISLRGEDYALTILARFPVRPILVVCAVIVGSTGVATLSQLGSTTNEMQLAALILSGLYCLLISIEKDLPTRWLALGGAVIGSAVGLKLTAAPFLVGALAAVAWIGYLRGRAMRHLLIFSTSSVLAFALLQGHWIAYLIKAYENPLFPYFNQIFKSEWWEIEPIKHSMFFPRNLAEWLFYPFYWIKHNSYLVMEGGFRDARIAVIYLSIATLLFQIMKHDALRLRDNEKYFALVIFTVAAYTMWLIQFSIYRYLIPLEVLSGIFLVEMIRRLDFGRLSILLTLCCSMAIVVWSNQVEWGHTGYAPGVVASDEKPEVPEGSLVLLLGDRPLGYVATLFPAEVRFIGVGNNLIKPGMKNRLQTEADRIIGMHDKAIFVVESLHGNLSLNNSYLAIYGLIRENCRPFSTSLDLSGLQFCEAHKDAQH